MRALSYRGPSSVRITDKPEPRIQHPAIISHRLPLEDAPHAYQIFARKQEQCRKVVLVPRAAA